MFLPTNVLSLPGVELVIHDLWICESNVNFYDPSTKYRSRNSKITNSDFIHDIVRKTCVLYICPSLYYQDNMNNMNANVL